MGDFERYVDPNAASPAGLFSYRSMTRRGLLRWWATGAVVGGAALLTGCGEDGREASQAPTRSLDPDNDPDTILYNQLSERFGPVPKPAETYRIGVVVKFLGNEYWKLLADGMQSKAKQYGLTLDVQGASSESDTAGQVAVIEEMIRKEYDALLVSPQTDDNLVASVDKAQDAGIRVVNVDDAVLPKAEHFVGPNQYENGVRAAKYIIGQRPKGGKVAVIEGQAGVYAAKRRTLGFKDTMAGTKFTIVASVSGEWDLQKSLNVSADLIRRYPDIVGFYCNNDIMALGTVEAVRKAGGLGTVIVIGTDGIQPAYASIRAGGLTATVDSFPYATGQIAVDVALRLLGDQKLPRVVFSPQNLITKENVDHPMPG